jgi:hypothetical protein
MRANALQGNDGVTVIAPNASEASACLKAVSDISQLDWSKCEIEEAEQASLRRASQGLDAACPALGALRRRLLDPDIGFAVWDARAIIEARDEDWHRHLLVILGAAMGEPFGAFKRHGFWKSIGVNTSIDPWRVEGAGFIPLHQDFVNAVAPPDLVLFRCVRGDPAGGGASLISNIMSAIAKLSEDERIALRSDVLREGAYFDLHGLGGERNPFPVLEYRAGETCVRFTAKVLKSMEPSPLRSAMRRLDDVLMGQASRHRLVPGQTLFLNQHFVCHGREPLMAPVHVDADSRLLEQGFVRFEQPRRSKSQ